MKKKVKVKEVKKVKTAVEEQNITYKSDDYLIVRFNGKPRFGLHIGGGHKLLLEAGVENEDTAEVIEFNPKDVLANLGKNPAIGKVFGVHVEPYLRSTSIPDWCVMRIYRTTVSKEEMECVKNAFASVRKILKKHKADIFIESLKQISLKNKTGKYAGMYKYVTKGDGDKCDEITLCPDDLTDEKYMQYVVAHEACHGIWFRSVPQHIKAKWIKLFSKRIILHRYSQKDLEVLLKSIQSYTGTLRDYIKEMADEDQTIILNEVISHIRKVHNIDKQDLEVLCLEQKDKLADLWPASADFGQKNYDPSEYALTKPKEFFAECMSYYLTGKKMSKDIVKACEVTLSKLTKY